jgi:hypothetical protein
MKWVNNTKGRPDSMLTFALIAFLVVTLNILLATFGRISFNGFEIGLEAMSSGAMGTYLSATFGAYVARRWTDKKYEDAGKPEVKVNE